MSQQHPGPWRTARYTPTGILLALSGSPALQLAAQEAAALLGLLYLGFQRNSPQSLVLLKASYQSKNTSPFFCLLPNIQFHTHFYFYEKLKIFLIVKQKINVYALLIFEVHKLNLAPVRISGRRYFVSSQSVTMSAMLESNWKACKQPRCCVLRVSSNL